MVHRVPVAEEADVVVVGLSTGAVEAALAAREAGARVFAFSRVTYPGEDVCATARYWLDADQELSTELARSVFGVGPGARPVPTPMQVKHGLERALIAAGVQFLYMTYPVCLVRDTAGVLAGVIVANRSGFQCIRARAVIDATDRATLARRGRGAFRPFRGGTHRFERVVVGGVPGDVPDTEVRSLDAPMVIDGRDVPAWAVTFQLPMPDASPHSFGAAEVTARLRTWHPDQAFASDRLLFHSPDRLDTGATPGPWSDAGSVPLGALRCGDEPLYVLGACADLSDDAVTSLMKPGNLMAVGRRVGAAAAEEALAVPSAAGAEPDYGSVPAADGCDVVRCDSYFRYEDAASIPFDLNRLPVIGSVDVFVAGGGTGGAPAGIGAARASARTLIAEYLHGLGGVGTEGRIAKYYHGNRCGFTSEIDAGVRVMGPEPDFDPDEGAWNTEWKKHWYLRAAAEAGADIWFGALSVAAGITDGRVTGVLVATPHGTGLVRSGCVVDATGNADVAAAAGAETVTISKAHVAVQGTGLSPFIPGQHYTNTDHTFVDDSDVLDVTRAFAVAREKFKECFDLAQIIDSRQRQQVRGDVSLDPLDFLAKRTFPDTVVTSESNFDSHGFTIHPVFMAKPPDKESHRAHVPFRCLLPVGLEGILVTGLGVSSHRDALPVIRMQPDVQNQGYAAGLAAARSARDDVALRELDIAALQAELVQVGILEPDVPGQQDSFPLPDAQVADAVRNGLDDYLGLAVIFAHPAKSVSLLRDAHEQATDPDRKVRCAHLLGLLGDDAGVDTLAAALDAREWDEGWEYTGMGQFGFRLSPVDSMLAALGRTGSPRALPAMLRKAESLGHDAEFSHYRALTLAFEALPAAEAVPHFVRLLGHFRGNDHAGLDALLTDVPESGVDTSERNRELTELLLARGLYACGDPAGEATEVLRAYGKDLHGHYARHARAILGAAAEPGSASRG